MGLLDRIKEFEFQKIYDHRGSLSFIEEGCDVPFSIKRVFYIYDIPGGAKRGGHANKKNMEVVMAASGSFDLHLSDGNQDRVFHLNRANKGVLIPPGAWVNMQNFTTGTIVLVVCSEFYDEDDYIRDFDEYKKYVANLEGNGSRI